MHDRVTGKITEKGKQWQDRVREHLKNYQNTSMLYLTKEPPIHLQELGIRMGPEGGLLPSTVKI